MEKLSDEQLREIREGCEGVTPGPWEADGAKNDGFESYEVQAPSGKSVVDTFNSGSIEIHEEDGRAWDEQGRKDTSHLARLDPQTISALIDELLALREASQWQPIETAPKDAAFRRGLERAAEVAMEYRELHEQNGQYDLSNLAFDIAAAIRALAEEPQQ